MRKFSHIAKVTVFALGVAIFGLAPAAQAMSERGHHKQGRHSYNNHSNKHNYNKRSHQRNYNRHSSRKYSSNRHYSSNRNYYGGSYYNSHRGGHHGSHGGEVALGLLTGGLLFYALTANERNSYNDRTVYVQQQPTYVQPTQQQWTQQQRVTQPEKVDTSCLQVREYQTTITVGNQSVPAYGQSCLQPDGSWKLGPAIPEPGY